MQQHAATCSNSCSNNWVSKRRIGPLFFLFFFLFSTAVATPIPTAAERFSSGINKSSSKRSWRPSQLELKRTLCPGHGARFYVTFWFRLVNSFLDDEGENICAKFSWTVETCREKKKCPYKPLLQLSYHEAYGVHKLTWLVSSVLKIYLAFPHRSVLKLQL